MSLLATLATDGDGVVGTGMLGVTTVPTATLTPKLNAPAVAWPSASETTRQLTVYTPSGRSVGSAIVSWSRCPATAWTGPASTMAPFTSSTWTTDSFGSGGSVNVMVTSAGAWSSSASAAGSELARFACAAAGPAIPIVTAPTMPSASSTHAMRLTFRPRS